MPNDPMFQAAVALVVLLGVSGGLLLFATRCYVRVKPETALLVSKPGDLKVMFGGALVMPVIHRAETIDLRVHAIEIVRSGKDGLICRDNIRADVKVVFFVRVNKTSEDILKVAQSIGASRASERETLENLFQAKFSEALKTIASKLDFEELLAKRDHFKFAVIDDIGQDLNGFVLDDLAIGSLEQTPLDQLDPNNILDAKGIEKITTATTEAMKRANQAAHDAKQAMIQLERIEASALEALRRDTGRTMTSEQLEEKITETLRTLVDEAVSKRLAAE